MSFWPGDTLRAALVAPIDAWFTTMIKSSSRRGARFQPLWKWLTLATATIACAPPLPPHRNPDLAVVSSQKLDTVRIDSIARQVVANGDAPGIAFAVVSKRSPSFARAYGFANLEAGSRMTVSSVFSIFSVTKVFTAVAIMQLRDNGALQLDDDLSKFFPKFPRSNEITIRQLLSHTAGIHDYGDTNDTLAALGATPAKLIEYIGRQPTLFDFAPGTSSGYSNSNFAILGGVIEKVSGQTYREYLHDHIVAKYGFRNTAVDMNSEVVDGRVAGYERLTSSKRFRNGPYIDMSFVYAAGGMRSTVLDLAGWFGAFFGGRVLPDSSLREMLAPVRLSSGLFAGNVPVDGSPPDSNGYYGLGIRSYGFNGHRAIGPGGSFASFSAKVAYYPDDELLLVVLVNAGGVAADIEKRMARALLVEH